MILVLAIALQAQSWTVQVEEPTGLYRRTNEVVAVPVAKLGNHTKGFTVTDAQGGELPWQFSNGHLLFPVSLIPGQLPKYHVSCCGSESATPAFTNTITLRKVGMQRVEFGNALFRAVIDTQVAAITDVYSLRTAPPRMLNLVETSPENRAALKGDIHETARDAATAIPPPVHGIDGENTGWTTLGGKVLSRMWSCWRAARCEDACG